MALGAVLIDLSGVLYQGGAPLPGAAGALARLRRAGLPLRFLTNTTRSPRRRILERLRAMGLEIREDELYSAPQAALDHLLAHGLRPWLLIHPDLEEDFAAVPREPANAVLVGDAGGAFTYERLNTAFRLLLERAPLLAMGRNRYFRDADGRLSLDAGPFVAALEYAAGVEAVVLGKPAAEFYHAVLHDLACAPGDAVMIGDDVEADVHGAAAAGLRAVLVRTGKYRPGDEADLPAGATVADDFAAAVDGLLAETP